MLSMISFVIVLSILVVVHEFGHFIVAKKTGVRVEKFSIGFGPELFGITKGGTRYLISLIPLGGYVKLAGETPQEPIKGEKWEYLSRTVGERARIIFAGPLLNYILAFFIFSFVFALGYQTLGTEVGVVEPGFPGVSAGIREGDNILKINGKDVYNWEDITYAVYMNNRTDMELIIERDGKVENLIVRFEPRRGWPVFGSRLKSIFGLKIGIRPVFEIVDVKPSIVESFYMGAKKLVILTVITFKALWAILIGVSPFKDSMTGLVGMYKMTSDAVRVGFMPLLHLMGVFSAALAIFNVLPIPVLDGGHLLFLIIEKVRRKPISYKMQENIAQVGLVLLMCLMAFVFYNDFVRYGVFEKILSLWRR